MCSFHPWAQLDGGRAAGQNPLQCRAERDRELVVELSGWSGRSLGLPDPPSILPWHQSHHALHPPTSHRSSPTSHPTGRSGPRLAQAIKVEVDCSLYAFHLLFKCPSKTYLYIWLGIGKISTAKRHQGIQGFVTHDPFPHLPSGCLNSNWNQMCCFLRQDGRQGRRNSVRR